MSTATSAIPPVGQPASKKEADVKPSNELVVRETIESLAVAFILALLFKAFVAEAFVIPTGSMAPTLMGAHKDIVSKESGVRFQVGASCEFDNELGKPVGKFVIGAFCPISRMPQIIDPEEDANEATFSGDRILVSKLAYVWNAPKRWDVIVFKFIEKARQNYIKRCVGLPNETIRVKEGDIFVRSTPDSPFEIARKPPHVMSAMMQLVNDTKYVPISFAKGKVPCPWQPQELAESGWESDWSSGKWTATGKQQKPDTSWLRYYHRVLDNVLLEKLETEGELPQPIDPHQPRLITDFAFYNSGIESNYDIRNENNRNDPSFMRRIKREFESKLLSKPSLNDGIHWVGDLAAEFEFETSADTKSVSFMIVEAGFRHIVTVDMTTGNAVVAIDFDGEKVAAFEDGGSGSQTANAPTSLRAGKKHRVKFANIDDQITLWVDGSVIDWSPSSRLRCADYVKPSQKGPRTTATDPLDGAPVGFGIAQGTVTISRAAVYRDIYYIAHGANNLGDFIVDYRNYNSTLRESSTREARQQYAQSMHGVSAEELLTKMSNDVLDRNVLASNPNLWGQSGMTTGRSMYEYQMNEDWYFPMGDNSAASSDARSWQRHHVPERLMIGRAVVVFWPHWWNAPIPFMPNFQRMGLIR
jgi:signal peptidase I